MPTSLHTARLMGLLACLTLALALAACTPPFPLGAGNPSPVPGIVNPSPVPGSALPALHITTAQGADVVLHVEVANTPEQHERGLMGRTTMPPDGGMVFDFGQSVRIPFWMHDTLIPLSIAWFTQEGRIVGLDEMAAQTDALHQPAENYWYALEANAGFFTAHGVAIGDQVTWPPK